MSHHSIIRAVIAGAVWALAAAAVSAEQSSASTRSTAERDNSATARPLPDLSGIWILDRAVGDLPERAVSALGAQSPLQLTIVQTPTMLTVSREFEGRVYASLYPLSGLEAVNDTPHGQMKSRARWEGSVLTIGGRRPLPVFLGKRQVPFEQQHVVSDDGRTMIVDLRLETPRGPRKLKATFHRTEK